MHLGPLPPDFTQNIQQEFSARGRLFLQALPSLIEEASRRWRLSEIRAAPQLSYNFVAFARRSGMDVVLKLGVPDRELTSEIHALRWFAGRGAVRLLESDSGRGMLLLERLQPGETLLGETDDSICTELAAKLMLSIRREPPVDSGLIALANWMNGFERLRTRFGGGTGPLDRALCDRAAAAGHELIAENHLPALIHGDLHHANILSSARGWVATDPKGVIGPAAYEVGPLLINPWVTARIPANAADLTRSRISILSEALGFEKERIRTWGLVHAVLSSIWSLEEGSSWSAAMQCAAVLARA